VLLEHLETVVLRLRGLVGAPEDDATPLPPAALDEVVRLVKARGQVPPAGRVQTVPLWLLVLAWCLVLVAVVQVSFGLWGPQPPGAGAVQRSSRLVKAKVEAVIDVYVEPGLCVAWAVELLVLFRVLGLVLLLLLVVLMSSLMI